MTGWHGVRPFTCPFLGYDTVPISNTVSGSEPSGKLMVSPIMWRIRLCGDADAVSVEPTCGGMSADDDFTGSLEDILPPLARGRHRLPEPPVLEAMLKSHRPRFTIMGSAIMSKMTPISPMPYSRPCRLLDMAMTRLSRMTF